MSREARVFLKDEKAVMDKVTNNGILYCWDHEQETSNIFV